MASSHNTWATLPGRIALQLVPTLIVLGVAVILVDRAWAALCPFDFPATDGPFQLYNALRRIDAGQLPGRDFPVFHGVGIPWAFLPFYRLFGGELMGSELARQVAPQLATLFVYAVVSVSLTRSLWPAAIWAIITLDLLPPIIGQLLPLGRLSDPGHSMYGFRGLAPLLAIAFMWRGGWLAAGAAIAASWLLGVEQGTYLGVAIAGTGIIVGLARWGNRSGAEGPASGQALMIGIALALVLLAAATGGKQSNALRYYFTDIPHDQIWYFGVPPNDYLGSDEPENRKHAIELGIAAAILAIGWLAAVIMARRANDSDRLRGTIVLAVGLSYGLFTLASSLGIFRHEFYYLAARVVILLTTAWAYRRIVDRLGAERVSSLPFAGLAAIAVTVALAIGIGLYAKNRWAARPTPALSERWKELAEKFPAEIRRVIPEPKTGDLWSAYASIVEDRLKIFHPREDYIIHALGDERARYVEDFAKKQPQFVQTMRRDTMKYEEWLQTTTWSFYERVLDNYEVVAQSPFSLLWRRTNRQWREPAAEPGKPLAMEPGSSSIVVPSDATSDLAIVRVEYDAIMPWAAAPLIGQQPRFLVSMPGSGSAYPVSLPPRRHLHEFPVPLHPGQPFTLEFQIRGLAPGAELRVKSVSVRYRKIPAVNQAFLQPSGDK